MTLVFALPPGSDPLRAKLTVCNAVRSGDTLPRFVPLTHSRPLVRFHSHVRFFREKVLIASSLENSIPALVIT